MHFLAAIALWLIIAAWACHLASLRRPNMRRLRWMADFMSQFTGDDDLGFARTLAVFPMMQMALLIGPAAYSSTLAWGAGPSASAVASGAILWAGAVILTGGAYLLARNTGKPRWATIPCLRGVDKAGAAEWLGRGSRHP